MILVLIIALSLFALPLINAHTPAWNIPTYAYVSLSPNTIGIGQYTIIVMQVDKPPPTASGAGGDRWRGFTVDITKPDGTKITMPYNGVSDQIGGAWMQYTPDQVGDYKIVFSWPGQTATNGTGEPNMQQNANVGDFYMSATSDPVILHVQQTPPAEWVEPLLPTGYWTRPLNVENRGWAQLASNYLKGSWLRNMHFQEEGQAPNSAHILWTKPIYQYGGIADARYGAVKIGPKDYEVFLPNPIIMAGKIYYNAYIYPWYGYYCVDLKTGATTYYKNGTDNGLNNPVTYGTLGATNQLGQIFPQLSNGQLYYYKEVNGAGVIPYLWMVQGNTKQTATSGGTMWYMLDANTGNWILSLKNVPGGCPVTDEQGDLLLYSYNPNTGSFLAWNSSQSIPPGYPTGTAQAQWKPRTGAVIDAVNDTSWTDLGPIPSTTGTPVTADDIRPHSGYTMNVTGPKGLPATFMTVLQDKNMVPKEIVLWDYVGRLPYNTPQATPLQIINMAVLKIDKNGPYSPFPDKSFTQNNNLGFSVSLLWNKNITFPISTGNMTFYLGSSTNINFGVAETSTYGKAYLIDYDDQVFCLWCKETRQYWGYDLTTGNQLWGPTASSPQLDYYAVGGFAGDTPGTFGYGTLFNAGYGGVLSAYNITTGKQMWNYTAPSVGHESPYGNYPLLTATIADGKVYEVTGEHSATQPMWRGAYIRCISAADGKELWRLTHFVMENNDRWLSIADGYIVAANEYDGQLYCIGIGPSATTVSAPINGMSQGSSFTITGTVTDQSAGTKNPSQQALFPNGVPAVSDASQQGFMEYLYEQQAMLTNATGVPVSLDMVDPNNNYVHLGDVTTDVSGFYRFGVDTNKLSAGIGTYKVIATFAGSNSYGSSSAESAFTVYSSSSVAPSIKPTQTISPTRGPTQTPISPSPSVAPQPTSGLPTMTYVAIAAAVVIIAVAAAAVVLRRRR